MALDALHTSCSVQQPSLPQRSLGPCRGPMLMHYLQVTDSHLPARAKEEGGATTCQNVPKTSRPRKFGAASRTDSRETKEPSELTSRVTFVPTVNNRPKHPLGGPLRTKSDVTHTKGFLLGTRHFIRTAGGGKMRIVANGAERPHTSCHEKPSL